MVLAAGFEPAVFALQERCFTVKLRQRFVYFAPVFFSLAAMTIMSLKGLS